MKIKRRRYDELLLTEDRMVLFMRAYEQMNKFDFYDFLRFFWGDSPAQEAFETHMQAQTTKEDTNAE